ncbi:pyrroline-5-carboxylate reductase [Stomatohabitans albus]|uniref:pyrroline-5-carboxylate reductase n=1 Tax=Stomatohabitans albus TaxID=3110766 RepID=UPI00300D9C2E
MITTILGCGTIGKAVLAANLANGGEPAHFRAVTSRPERAELVADEFGVVAGVNARVLVHDADLVVLGVKPHQLTDVLKSVASDLAPGVTLLSLAAGVTSAAIEEAIPGAHVIRAMPNLGARIGKSATSVSYGALATEADMARARQVLEPAGTVTEVPEHLINAVIGVAGSAPAWFLTVLEAVIDAGVANGLSYDAATQMAASTMEATAALVKETGTDPGVLRKAVCSPGGTTIAGMAAAEQAGLRAATMAAVQAAHDRGVELS